MDLLNFINSHNHGSQDTEDKVQQFIENHKKKNTTRQTKGAVKKLKTWLLMEKLEIRELDQLQATEMNDYLAEFFVNLNKPNGDPYEPSSLKGIHITLLKVYELLQNL